MCTHWIVREGMLGYTDGDAVDSTVGDEVGSDGNENQL